MTESQAMGLSALQNGGPAVLPLLLLSIVVVAIGVDRARYWRGQGLGPARVERQLAEALQGSAGQGHGQLRQELLLRQLERQGTSGEAVLEAAAVVGPLLGLIGTVAGLIRALTELGPQLVLPSGGASLTSYSQVLVSTLLGLVVALIATVVLRTNRGLLERQRQQLETAGLRLALERQP
ncbi:MotA/TolQ/ExbB proton channel family protein [Cyanobium sp. Morenito 9A2]|uniref:MotA/TolQ/ExbB proton channel family protein n=1 Tax=Cyanobium sp. Morenito 9A2 TaxID=2823718 RepID=UPI0020CC357C|nr:MotA/TolQ/ExbB proton channel family protein [Cyanobium sp. Morenito 9A2]MCP9848560.1 MotA/TolQ/ExbB proton channel family protein [Cyanobium sp. Morenito 9A2]